VCCDLFSRVNDELIMEGHETEIKQQMRTSRDGEMKAKEEGGQREGLD